MRDSDIWSNEIRKGFLKMIILRIVQDRPSHGYEIIQEIGKRTGGNWAPSPGSIYPALEYLESKGYLTFEEQDRKKIYTITPKAENAIIHLKEKKMQWLQELDAFFGENFEKDND